MHESDPESTRALVERLARIEQQLEEVQSRVGNLRSGGGGIGCLGFFLFVVVLSKLGDILKAIERLS